MFGNPKALRNLPTPATHLLASREAETSAREALKRFYKTHNIKDYQEYMTQTKLANAELIASMRH